MKETGTIIPCDRLSPETLQGLVEEFVSRDGTDTGYIGQELQERVAQVMAQLRKGSSVIVYDAKMQTANIVPRKDLK